MRKVYDNSNIEFETYISKVNQSGIKTKHD